MLRINESSYRLVGLDTNVVGEILRDSDGARRGFLSLFADGSHIPCFTVYSNFELRRRTEIYEQFVEFFDVYPCMLLKNEEQLFDDELADYPSPTDVDPALLGFSQLNTERGTNLKNVMAIAFQNPDTLRREREWPKLQQELLDKWIAMTPNYRPKGKHFIPPDGIQFVKQVTQGQIAERAPDWVRQARDRGESISHKAFPSLRMTAWTVFFRLYLADRRPEPQDVFDVLISTPAPYLDVVITENFQAEIYRQVRKLDPSLVPADVYTLKDLRAAARA